MACRKQAHCQGGVRQQRNALLMAALSQAGIEGSTEQAARNYVHFIFWVHSWMLGLRVRVLLYSCEASSSVAVAFRYEDRHSECADVRLSRFCHALCGPPEHIDVQGSSDGACRVSHLINRRFLERRYPSASNTDLPAQRNCTCRRSVMPQDARHRPLQPLQR